MTSNPHSRVRGRKWNPDEWPLGRYSDYRVAMMAGVTTPLVRAARRKRCIPPTSPRGPKWTPDHWPLGLVRDGVVAKHLSIDPQAVGHARRKRGVPPLSPGRREELGHRWEAMVLRWCLDAEQVMDPEAVSVFARSAGVRWERS